MGLNPVMLDVNGPLPLPSLVFVLRAVVGLGLVLQHTPRTLTLAPPSEVIFPPLEALFCVILLILDVVTVGTVGAAEVVKLT